MHQAAQRITPDAVVVYVDNDPVVAAHGLVLLEENDNTHLAAADLTDPDLLLRDPAVASHLDFTRPLAVIQSATCTSSRTSQTPLAPGGVCPINGGSDTPGDTGPCLQ